jgi:hypothetical protein
MRVYVRPAGSSVFLYKIVNSLPRYGGVFRLDIIIRVAPAIAVGGALRPLYALAFRL